MNSRAFLILPIVIAVVLVFLRSVEAGDNRASQILTPELAQQLLGPPVEPAAKNAEPDTKSEKTRLSFASYSMKGGDFNAPRLSLMIRQAGSKEEAQQIFLSSKKTYSGVDVAGLGELAYRVAAPAQLNVLKGADWLIISAGSFKTPDPAMQEKAAREILKKLAP